MNRILMLLLLMSPCLGMAERHAVSIVVNDVRKSLRTDARWKVWSKLHRGYFTIYELKPYRGYFSSRAPHPPRRMQRRIWNLKHHRKTFREQLK